MHTKATSTDAPSPEAEVDQRASEEASGDVSIPLRMLLSVSDEEYERLAELSAEDIEAALQEGAEARREAEEAMAPPMVSGIWFR